MDRIETLFEKNLPNYHQLKKIRENLWAEDGKSSVSVMIGSGFSLNANKIDDSVDSMSTWSEIKEKILDGLKHSELSKSKDVLDISESYVAEFGRGSLDSLLKQTVPDQNYEPGEIHKKLLRLPWADVYTTNYDTLLERTLSYIFERNYQVIHDIRDIPNSVSPRIVKLHGSFPSNRPFIFTRSDYNSYEEDFAPMVNMVQQSIMETTFVLLGFSGDDPNFESWTKWVHKNLGEHMPKIYMLAYGENERESKLKERRITLIDFKDVYKDENIENVYEHMFNDVFQYLSYKEKKDERDWPYKSYISKNEKLLETFIYNRENYPGWLIMPDIIKKRNTDVIQLACIELRIFAANSKNEMTKRISAVIELIWVYDTFQIPIDFGFHKMMKKFINENTISDYLNGKEIIILRLLKEARLDYADADFNTYLKLLENRKLSVDDKNRLIYEKILMMTAKFEYKKAKSLLEEWSLTNKDSEWIVKKAIIFSRFGDEKKAIEILENNLTIVREKISKNNNNYRLLSLEGIMITILIRLGRNNMQDSKERLLTLETKLSNPMRELDFIFSRIKPYEEKTGLFVKKGFDPYHIIRTSKTSNTLDMELIDSYSMLMLFEEFGLGSIGQMFEKNAVNIAIRNMTKLYPFYQWILYLRFGDIKEIDHYFSRNIIYRIDINSLSLFAEIVMDGIRSKHKTKLMLDVLSRVYFALRKDEKEKVDKIVIELYKNKSFLEEHRGDIKNIFKPLFRRILHDKNYNEIGVFMSEVYRLPIIGDPQGSLSEIIVDDFHFYDPSFEFKSSEQIIIDVDIDEINRLLNILKGEKGNIRDASLRRLTFLLETNNFPNGLDTTFRKYLADMIRIEKSNYSNVLLESYLVLKTNDEEIQEQYSDLLIQESIPKSHDSRTGITAFGPGLENLLIDLRNVFPKFNNKEIHFLSITDESYTTWLKNFFVWWDNQEEWLLREQPESLFGERDDLLNMIIFLKNSFLSNIPIKCLTKSDKDKLEKIYLKLYERKPQMALLLVPVLLRVVIDTHSGLDKILDGLFVSNIEVFKSSVSAIFDLSVLKSQNEITIDFSRLIDTILDLFIYRKEITLIDTTKSITNIIQDVPDSFNDNGYQSIVRTLKMILDDVKRNYYLNSSISDQETELLSALANLAGQVYSMGKTSYKRELNDWKTFVEDDRLPEVRKYSYLFE